MLSYGDNMEFHFDSRVTQLNGPNGSGKSSIPTILEDLFYNKTSRGIKKKSLKNRNLDTNKYWSSAEFELHGKEFYIEKVVTSSTNLRLICDGEDISGHTPTQTYKTLKELLGLEFNTFSKLVYQSTSSSLDFLLSTDAKRKQFLTSLLGLEEYTNIGSAVKSRLTEVKSDIKACEKAISSLKKVLSREVPSIKDELTLPEVEYLDEDYISELRERISQIRIRNSKISDNEANKVALSKLDLETKPEPPSYYSERESLKKEYDSIRAKHSAAKAEYEKLTSVRHECPTCGTKLTDDSRREHIEKEKKSLIKRIDSLVERYEVVKEKLQTISRYEKELQTYQNKKDKYEEFEGRIDYSLPSSPENYYVLQKEIEELQSKHSAQLKELRRIEEYNQNVRLENSKAESLIEQKKEFEKENAELNEELESLEYRKDTLDVLNQAYGTRGLIAYKIEATTKVFEDLINEYLQVLSKGRFNLVFDVEDTKLALRLYDSGEEIEINCLSSGEFNRVNTASLLAIRKMMTSISKVDLNVLFLDEVVSVLDKEGKDTLIEVLLSEENLNSVVVSHGYVHPLTDRVYVDKHQGVSSLSMEADSG